MGDRPAKRAAEPYLPHPIDLLVGRERELAAVHDLLLRPEMRLLNLTGPGGVGKTRLAIAAAALASGDFDGFGFVGLAAIHDAELVLPTIAQTLAPRESDTQSPIEGLRALFQDRRFLLVLDNFEQVLDAAPGVAMLLREHAGLKALVTSRIVLRVTGERAFPVRPLDVPDDMPRPSADSLASAAVRLFAARAEAVDPAFIVDAKNAAAVVEICRRLDGLPLAIELAAARVRHLPPPSLLARLESRLPLLTGGPRDLPARQRTMRDAIAWSYGLLPSNEQRVFRRLAVFAGGFTLDAAEAVSQKANTHPSPIAHQSSPSSVLDNVTALLDASLLRRATGERSGEPRFVMLETIREYGLEQLSDHDAEEAEARDALASWCIAFAEQTAAGLHGPEQRRCWERLEEELPNLRTALAWIDRRGDADAGLRLTGALTDFIWLRGHLREGRAWLERALARGGEVSPAACCQALFGAGCVCWFQGDYDAAIAQFTEAMHQAEAAGVPTVAARALYMLANVGFMAGVSAVAAIQGEEAVARLRAIDDSIWLAYALNDVGTGLARIDPDRGRAFSEEGLALSRTLGNRYGAAIKLSDLGVAEQDAGDDEAALTSYRESLALFAELGDAWYLANPLAGIACVYAERGAAEQAARLLGAADALQQSSGAAIFPSVEKRIARIREHVCATLGRERFAAAQTTGAALPLDELVAAALQTGFADIELEELAGASSAAPFGLTPRERDVLQLLAGGSSNRQIAETLFISPLTAKVHVASILAKLGVVSRTAAAALAVREGLT